MVDAERGEAFLAEPCSVRGGRVAGEELQPDRRLDVGEDRPGSWPVRVEQRGELVGGGDAQLDDVLTGAHHRAQRFGLRGERGRWAEPVAAQPQILGDHRGVAGVGLGAGEHLALTPGLDRVGADRDHRMPGLEQRVDEPPVWAFDGHRGVSPIVGEPAETTQQVSEPVRGVGDGEVGVDLSGRLKHAHRVGFGGPVDTDVELGLGQGHDISSQWQQRLGEEAVPRAVTDWRSRAHPSVAGQRPRENRGRPCHPGPQRATTPGRHPGSRRVPTTSTLSAPAEKRVDQ